jgi:uncharacterized membrane protein
VAVELWRSAQNLAALYVLSHGRVKIVLVWEILHNRFWAHLGLICLTIGFMIHIYGSAEAAHPNFLAIWSWVRPVVLSWTGPGHVWLRPEHGCGV